MEKIEREFELERLVFFSDAVFAIAITLLALTLEVPDLGPGAGNVEFLSALRGQSNQLLAFLISFAVIGELWLAHHRIFRLIKRYDAGLLGINLGLLLTVVILPWPTELIATYGHLSAATIIYAIAVAATGVMLLVLWSHAHRHGLMVEMSPSVYRDGTLRTAISPTVFLLSIPIALWNPTAAKLFWIVLLPAEMVIDSRIGRATRGTRSADDLALSARRCRLARVSSPSHSGGLGRRHEDSPTPEGMRPPKDRGAGERS